MTIVWRTLLGMTSVALASSAALAQAAAAPPAAPPLTFQVADVHASPPAALRSCAAATSPAPSGAISLFDAINKQLGLKLEKQRRPEPALVIDHIDDKPTEN